MSVDQIFHHVVLFRMHDGADAEAAVAVLDASRPDDGVVDWVVTRSLDDRKGVVVVESVSFVDQAAFEEFRDSAAHRAAGAHMAQVSDWLVGDYEE